MEEVLVFLRAKLVEIRNEQGTQTIIRDNARARVDILDDIGDAIESAIGILD